MQLRPFSLRHLLLKVVIFAATFYVAVIALSVLITGFLFISLNSYKTRIEGVIFRHTGYTLTVENITTKLSPSYLPEVVITNARLTNPSDSKQNFSVKQLAVTFSYLSLWNLEPIFNQISIDGTDINLEYLADGSIIFNGININHPDVKTIENTKNSPIDLENWILKQEQIKLSNINFSFTDKKNNFPTLELKNITTTLANRSATEHNLSITVGIGNNPRAVGADLAWQGGKVTQFQDWQSAELKLQTYNNNDPITGTVEQYLPGISFLQAFYAETALDAQIKEGKLQYLYANFDIKNFQYALHSNSLINFPQLGGNLKINLVSGDTYKIAANNLTIATPTGYVFDNKNITGDYNIGKKGQLTIEDTSLKNFNNLLVMLPINNISLDGNIEILKLNWLGNVFHPEDFLIYSRFTNLAIISKNEDIPSLNNISGDLSVSKSHGTLNLALKNSTLLYKKVFLIPYKFKSLSTKVTWNINKDKTFDVILGHTNLETIDFKGSAYGKYTYTPGTTGFLELYAHVDRVLTSKVGDYLPKVIGMDVHKWLNMGLVGGYGVNADLQLKGWLSGFPYAKNDGLFYITAGIEKAKLRYVKEWPTLDNIMGTFKIRNQKIIIETNSASVSGNHIEHALVVIPSMVDHHAYLVADGLASGSTANFMHYLQQTPINDIIGKIPEKVATDGDGFVNLHLNVPFSDPEHTQVSGFYDFYNNNIKFDLPVPVMQDVAGRLYFSEHGIKIDNLAAEALNSNVTLSANTDTDGVMHFKVNSPNLDYKATTKFYTPFLYKIFEGNALTNIYFDIGKHGINRIWANSNLDGVAILAAPPMNKKANAIESMNFNLVSNDQAFDINFSYSDLLMGKIHLNNHGKIDNGQIAIGTGYIEDNPNKAKIIIHAALDNTQAMSWLDTVEKLLSGDKTEQKISESEEFQARSEHAKESTEDIFPVEVYLRSGNLYFESASFSQANADILVTKDKTIFAINGAQMVGFGTYTYASKALDLNFDEFRYFKSIDQIFQNKSESSTHHAITKSESNAITTVAETKVEISSAITVIESQDTSIKKILNNKQFTESSAANLNFPHINLLIQKFYFENHLLGQLNVRLMPSGQDLLIESGILTDHTTATILFNGINYCVSCGIKKSFVNLNISATVKNLGQLLENLDYGKIVAKGNGDASASVQWNGQLQDFNFSRIIATTNINIKSGKFLKVNTASILGSIIGLINLQTLVSFAKLDFGDIFENGFYFDQIYIKAYLLNSKIDLKNLYMTGPLASVHSIGNIDIPNDSLNLYLSITPRLGLSVAVAAALATANPIVGVITYGAELVLGNPFNKLFTFSYHITGSMKKPDIKKISVSKQIVKNVNAAIGN